MTAKKLELKEYKIERPQPVKLTAEEVRKRMQEFAAERKEKPSPGLKSGAEKCKSV